MTAIPPSLKTWSKCPQNRYSPDEFPAYWKTHDVITVLADTGMYDETRYHCLDTAEKEQHRQLKSDYFKKRFTVSRSLLRQILPLVPGMENGAGIVMTREKNGRIRINNRPDIFISLSYSGAFIALTLGKRKVGSDIGMVHPRDIRKIRTRPLLDSLTGGIGRNQDQRLVHAWTLLEAYAKFRDMSLYPLTRDRFSLSDAHFVSYCIDSCAILSLAYEGASLQDSLLWIDPGCGSSRGRESMAAGSPLPYGGTNVRA